MDSLEPKKLALIRILQILESYSNSEHPMTQVEIAERMGISQVQVSRLLRKTLKKVQEKLDPDMHA